MWGIIDFFFSKDCVHWGLLPPPTEEMRLKAHLAKGRFTGDPSFEFEHVEVKRSGEGDEMQEDEETVYINFLSMVVESKMQTS